MGHAIWTIKWQLKGKKLGIHEEFLLGKPFLNVVLYIRDREIYLPSLFSRKLYIFPLVISQRKKGVGWVAFLKKEIKPFSVNGNTNYIFLE